MKTLKQFVVFVIFKKQQKTNERVNAIWSKLDLGFDFIQVLKI